MKYSDFLCKALNKLGYKNCFALAGGNIMHMMGSAVDYFELTPVVNEICAGIASEYFNEIQNRKKSFALVTAGPGLTNIITACAGAFLESRELLIIGGQVKIDDLKNNPELRQRGIQEIDGVELMKSITKKSVRMDYPFSFRELEEIINFGSTSKKGPIFIEIPLDIQARNVDEKVLWDDFSSDEITSKISQKIFMKESIKLINDNDLKLVQNLLNKARRPLVLFGGGLSREVSDEIYESYSKLGVPIATTWNGFDRIGAEHPLYFGRPNIWGQRYSNIILQQSDLLIAIGSRLGIQQTGFNHQTFIPNGKIIQIDCDLNELEKGHPKIDLALCCDANDFAKKFFNSIIWQQNNEIKHEWLDFCNMVKSLLPLNEIHHNSNSTEYISPYSFVGLLSEICNSQDLIIPCSSGGAYTVMMQGFKQKKGQRTVTNKALASMGYGLSGAIGASMAYPQKRTILVEGDGGFAQNLQEIATAVANNLNLKIFIFENSGYASIRMTQKNYFNGRYVGCDIHTGLGFPNWVKLFEAYKVASMEINDENFVNDENFLKRFNNKKCEAFIVKIDPEQTYFPKISSRIKADGGMESNPLHLMTPDLEPELAKKVFKYF